MITKFAHFIASCSPIEIFCEGAFKCLASYLSASMPKFQLLMVLVVAIVGMRAQEQGYQGGNISTRRLFPVISRLINPSILLFYRRPI